MTDQPLIFNVANSHAELVAEHVARISVLPMTVVVTVYHHGESIAEGFATTDDYRPQTREPDPDVVR